VDERVAEARVRAEPPSNGATPHVDEVDEVDAVSPVVDRRPAQEVVEARPVGELDQADLDDLDLDDVDSVPAAAPEDRERPPTPRPSWRWTRRDRAVAIVVAVGLLIGLPIGLWVLSKIDTAEPKGTVTEIGTIAGSRSPAEVQPVQVTGAALPVPVAGSPVDPAVGMPAPRIAGYGFDGRPLRIDPAGGRKLVMIVSPDCESCTVDLVNMMSWRQQGRAPEGLEVWTVSSGSKPGSANDPPSEWFKGKGWNFAVIADSADGAAVKAYGVSAFPTLLMIDEQGNVVHRMTGPVDVDQLDSALATYLPAG
jgi:hypothetical protein